MTGDEYSKIRAFRSRLKQSDLSPRMCALIDTLIIIGLMIAILGGVVLFWGLVVSSAYFLYAQLPDAVRQSVNEHPFGAGFVLFLLAFLLLDFYLLYHRLLGEHREQEDEP